jgi:hypothetical protein
VPAGVNGREFAMAAAPSAPAVAETAPQPVVASAAAPATMPDGLLAAPVAMANGARAGGLAVFGYVRHGDDNPLPGAPVTLIDPAGRQAGIGHSGPDGRYEVRVPERGSYTLIAMAASYEPFASAVRVAEQPAEVDMLLSGASRLSGTVRAASTREPLANVTVTLANGNGEVVGTAVTGPDGSYSVDSLVAGQYTLAVSAPSFQPVALPAFISDGQPAVVDADLRTGARVEGTARSTAGGLVPEARVTLLDPEGNVAGVATTGADGSYSFENLPEGEYTVIAAGYPPAASRLKVAGSDPHSHDVELGHPEA